MSGEWRDLGEVVDIGDVLFLISSFGFSSLVGPKIHEVENVETEEIRRVAVGSGQTVGEAIENGQFVD